MPDSSNTRGNQTNYKLDVGDENQPQTISDLYNPGHPDSGNAPRGTGDPAGRVAFDQNNDISRASKVTLGNYLSNATRGQVGTARPNVFQLPPDSSDNSVNNVDANLSTRRATAARSDIESNGTTIGTFLDHAKGYTDTNRAARIFESTKDSDYGRNGNNPFRGSDIDIKNYSDPEARRRGQDGNSVLLNVNPRGAGPSADLGNPNIGPDQDDAPIVQKKISEVLRQNRFNPLEKAFIQNHTWTGPGVTLQRQLGVHEKDNGKFIKQGLLEQLGLKLMIRATGHSVPGLDLLDSTNNLKDTNNFAPLLPSAPQLTGLPLIDVVNLRAGNVPVVEDVLGVGAKSQNARTEYINDVNGAQFQTYEGSTGSTWGEAFAGKSYGVLNSHIEPFGGPLPIGTFTTTLAGIIAIVGASALVAMIPLIIGGAQGTLTVNPRRSTQDADPATLIKGKRGYRGQEPEQYDSVLADPDFWLNYLGIPKTDHNWGLCLIIGIAAFFGVETTPGVAGQAPTINAASLADALFFLATAPGYYAVVIRNAIRDTEQIVRAIEDFAQAAADTNVIRAISGIFKLIESITTSALYRFIMAMTALGNQVLNYVPNNSDPLQNYPANDVRMRSRIKEDSSTNSSEVIERDILKGDLGSTKASALAWKHSAPKSVYILPRTFTGAALAVSGSGVNEGRMFPGLDSRLSESERMKAPDEGRSRLSSDTVKLIEQELEAEYVPFYFHDLRTNEIIAFHAFLNSLSDGFTASYNSTTGYGRADDVMVYSNTKRSISFDFVVAATSREDFDVMYWNINKLITMLYPQYSRGRAMASGDLKFIQPFSQIPTASPMIRLRIGDIIRGNYSKFGLARLFGLGQDANSFNAQSVNLAQRSHQAEVTRTETARLAGIASEGRVGQQVRLTQAIQRTGTEFLWCNESGTSAVSSVTTTGRGRRSTTTYNLANNPEPSTWLREQINAGHGRDVPSGAIVEIVRVLPAGNSFGSDNVHMATSLARFLVKLISLPNEPNTSISTNYGAFNYFFIEQSAVPASAITQDYIASQVARALASNPGPGEGENQALTNVTNFFSKEENPIIKSFETTRGRGLAGFITDLKMDWADYTWEIERDSRAPKAMKLSVAFTPVHDIPMGLDADGMMRSVAYPVGGMSKSVTPDQYAHDRTTDSPAGSGGTST